MSKEKNKKIKGDDPKVKALFEKFNDFRVNSSLIRLGNGLSGAQGTGFGGERDLYDSVGWIECPAMTTYLTYYKRTIGKTVVDIHPTYMWNGPIKLAVSKNKDSKLPSAWKKLDKSHNITNTLLKADKLAGIMNYSVIFLGLDDSNASKPEKPVSSNIDSEDGKPTLAVPIKLRYLKVFRQDYATVKKINGNISDKNFGKVESYDITTLSSESTGSESATESIATVIERTGDGNVPIGTKKVEVHASRCVHIAEDIQDGEIYGTPRMEVCINNIQDLEKVNGGSAEMFWRGALPGWAFSVDPEAEYDEDDIEDMDAQIDDMLLGLKRSLKLQGITPTSLAPQVSDPRPHAEVQLKMISSTRRIPMRLLTGSESGELASSQDSDNWDSEIESRRRIEGEPWVRAVVDRLMEFRILPYEEEYEVIWPPVNAQNEELRAKKALNLSLALKNYTTSVNPEKIMPINKFLVDIMGFSDEESREIEVALKETENELSKFSEQDAIQAVEDEKLIAESNKKLEEVNAK